MRARRLLVAIIAGLGLLTPLVTAGSLPPGGTFVDDDGNTHEGYIEAIYEAGITAGCNPPTNDMYCPADSVTRAQMATFIAKALGLPPSDDNGAFTDHLSSVHRQNINAIRIAGVTGGCNPPTNDMYCPADYVTRAQMATFIAKALGLPPSDDDGAFTDHLASVHRRSINAIRIEGVTLGCNPPDNTMYCPSGFVTRAQMATFLGRALGLTPDVPPPPFTYADPVRIPGLEAPGGGVPSAAVDLNADGHMDLIYAPSSGLNTGPALPVMVLLNDGSGDLVDGTADFFDGPVPEFFVVRDLVIDDFNGDDRPDIYFNNHGNEDPPGEFELWPCERNALYLSQPNGKLADVTATNLPVKVDFSHGSTAGDIDGDGDIDIWVNNLGVCADSEPSYLLENDGDGSFTIIADASDFWPVEQDQPFWAQFVDADGDDVADLLYLNHGESGLLLNDGKGGFTDVPDAWVPKADAGYTTQDSDAVDIDGDGLDDVVLYQTPDDFSPGSMLQILISVGDGSFTDETDARLPEQTSDDTQGGPHFWTTDFEGDGDVDVFVLLFGEDFIPENDVYDFYVNDGEGVFQELGPNNLPPVRPEGTPIDLNGDGKMDFVFVNLGVDDGAPNVVMAL